MIIRLCVLLFMLLIAVSANSRSCQAEDRLPWDYDPYRVLVWIAGVDAADVDGDLGTSVKAFLDRDFKALWRTNIVSASPELATVAQRDFSALDYGSLTASDSVLVIKRDHENAARIRFPADIPERLGKILVAEDSDEVFRKQLQTSDNEHTRALIGLLQSTPGNVLDSQQKWPEKTTEAMLLPRGVAMGLEPQPKLVELDIPGRFGAYFNDYDKVFLVSVENESGAITVSAREIDSLMRWPGPILTESIFNEGQLADAIGRCVIKSFAPLVRLDDVGNKGTALGRLRAGGLILDENSPANVRAGEFLRPFLRKNDRLGEPTFAGPVDWTYLRTMDKQGPKLSLQIQTGIGGALAGRRNSRTFRVAMKIRPTFDDTTLRLHAKGDPLAPLAGYDVYQKDLDTGEFKLIGQTDWDGRLRIGKTDVAMRLLYVKNGSFILAKLPLVPGQTELEVADLVGDDIRLQAEAYIRGVQNAIVDLVAIRKLLAANIEKHIKNGELERAEELLDELKKQPSYDKLADDMELKKTEITSRNRTEQVKIDRLFAETRTLLIKHINPVFFRELETELNAAKGMPTGSDAEPEPTTAANQ